MDYTNILLQNSAGMKHMEMCAVWLQKTARKPANQLDWVNVNA